MRLLSLFIALLLILPASAAIVKRSGTGHALTKAMTLSESLDLAGIIFKGKFIDSEIIQEGKTDVRVLKFSVLDPIKGVSSDKLVLKEWAQMQTAFSTGEIEAGRPYIFMFYSPSSKGLTSLIGEEQGYIDVGDEQPRFSKRMLRHERKVYAGITGALRGLGHKKASEIKSYTEFRNLAKSN